MYSSCNPAHMHPWSGRLPMVSRRQLLRGAAALATASLVTPTRSRLARAQARFTTVPPVMSLPPGGLLCQSLR